MKVCYLQFVEDLRYVYNDEQWAQKHDRIVFLSTFLELERRKHTSMLFEIFRWCLPHSSVCVPYVGLGSPSSNDRPADLSAVTVPLQCYLFSLGQDFSFLTDPASIAAGTFLVDDFADGSLVPSYDPWTIVDIHRRSSFNPFLISNSRWAVLDQNRRNRWLLLLFLLRINYLGKTRSRLSVPK